MKLEHLAAVCLLALCSLGSASAEEARVVRPSASTAIPVGGVAPEGSAEEAKRYAARDAASPDAKNYRGGDPIVISATTVAIVLLVVLILVIL